MERFLPAWPRSFIAAIAQHRAFDRHGLDRISA
jgi:hypothetical protein